MRRALFLALVLCGAVAAGCAGGGDDDDDDGGCQPLASDDLATIQSQVFNVSCALASCHDATAPQEQLDLSSAAASHANLVGVTAVQLFQGNPILLVDTLGGPSESYLIHKLRGTQGIQPNQMPDTGQELCEEHIQSIESWIEAGAPL